MRIGRIRLIVVKGRKIGTTREGAEFIASTKAIRKLKSDGEITIRFHIVGWGDNEMAIEVRCDAGGILTKGWGKSQIKIC